MLLKIKLALKRAPIGTMDFIHLSQVICTFARPSSRWVVRASMRVPTVAKARWKVVRKIGLSRGQL